MRQIKYKVRKCEKCEKLYIPKSSTQKWCNECLTKKCEYCGKDFSVKKKSKYDSTKFCCIECKGKYQSEHRIGKNALAYKNGNRTKRKIKCSNCGKEILKENQFINNFEHNFCDRKCQIEFYQNEENKLKGYKSPKYSKVEVRCEWCGQIFKTYKSTKDIVRFCCMDCRNKWQSEMMKGSNHPNWKGGKSEARHLDMSRKEYKEWRRNVFKRDNYTCRKCGDNKGGNLNAHHIKTYAEYPELRYDIDNGITLCEKCHQEIHSKK